MSILLINAPYPRPSKFFGQPTSALYAASIAADWFEKTYSHSFQFVNFNSWPFDDYLCNGRHYLENVIKSSRPRLVAISSTSAAWSEARRIAHTAKACGVPFVMLGGPHEDDVYQKTAGIDENVDISVAGDGETPFYVFAKAIIEENCETIADIDKMRHLWRGADDVFGQYAVQIRGRQIEYVSSRFGRQRHLDTLPFMPRHLMAPREKYHYPIFQEASGLVKRTTQVMTQRGCVAKCDFCSESQRLNSRSVSSVITELQKVIDSGYQAVFFDDSTFTNLSSARREYVETLCCFLREQGLEWGCQTRVDTIDEDLCRLMSESGCSYVYFGLETAVSHLLHRLGKKYQISTMDYALRICQDTGIRVGASLILGTPDTEHRTMETAVTAETTFKYIRAYVDSGPIQLVSINLYGYYPGTHATQEYEAIYPNTLGPDAWETVKKRDSYPFSLLEEFPARMPIGLLEIGPELLLLADNVLGDVLIGQDKYTRAARIPANIPLDDRPVVSGCVGAGD